MCSSAQYYVLIQKIREMDCASAILGGDTYGNQEYLERYKN